MEELWQQTSEMLLRRPLLWLPVLIADLSGFLVTVGNEALVKADLLRNLRYHTALGGVATHAQVSAAAVEHVTLVALLLSWAASFLHILLYTLALTVTAYLVSRYIDTRRGAGDAAALPRATAGGVLSLTFQTWVIYVVLTFGFGWLSRSLITHGHKAVLAGGWFELGGAVLLFAVLAFVLAPAAVQMLAQHRTPHLLNSRAQLFAFLLGLVALLLGHYVLVSIHSVHITEAVARYALEITGSWIAALPYAAMFTGLSLLAVRSLTSRSEIADVRDR